MSSITIDNTSLFKLHLRLGLLTQAIFHQLQNCCINKGGGAALVQECWVRGGVGVKLPRYWYWSIYFYYWVKLEFLRLTIHSEEASNSSIECHLSKEWLLLWCNCKKNSLILFPGCIKFMWTQHSVHSGYQDDLGKISCTCSCSFTLSLSTQEWQNVQKWMGGGGRGRVESSVCTTFATNSVTGKFAFNFYQTRK